MGGNKVFYFMDFAVLVLLGLLLLIANPDKAVIKEPAKTTLPEETTGETPLTTEAPAQAEEAPQAIIGDDEGC